MSDLSNLERRRLEKLLGMESGYVLDFSNRTVAEFIFDSTGLQIYDARYNYASNSKANRLRRFWQLEDNRVVGKLMLEMLDYGFPEGQRSGLELQCRQIAVRLLGNASVSDPMHASATPVAPDEKRRAETLLLLKTEFLELAAESDRNRAGLALEGLLNRLFELFQLHPRRGFRVTGEQIDGSFELADQVYLVESKWERHALSEADLLVFRGKIEGKSTFTRGVFIALNDVSAAARDAITRGKAPSFFVMNGHDLMMILSGAITLPDFLRYRVRLLAEEGKVCVPFSDLTAHGKPAAG
jgi:hypothetical protein